MVKKMRSHLFILAIAGIYDKIFTPRLNYRLHK